MLSRNCTENTIRLSGGNSHLEGRVEVCVNGDWGMVTLDGWDYRDAAVACRELGYSSLGKLVLVAIQSLGDNTYTLGAVDIDMAAGLFGEGSGGIALSNISCDIMEANLTSCSSITSLYDSDDVVVGAQCRPGELKYIIQNLLVMFLCLTKDGL